MKWMHVLSFAAVFATGLPARADVGFWNVIDSVGTFSGFNFQSVDGFAGVGNGGNVVFSATTTDGVQGVFAAQRSSSVARVTALVDDSGVYDSFDLGVAFMNDSGVAAVTATRDDGETEILTVDLNGTITPLVDTTGAFNELSKSPDINNDGTVAFRGELDSGVTGIYTASGTTEKNVVDEIDTSDGVFSTFFIPFINNAGDILYLGNDSKNEVNQLILVADDGSRSIARTAPFGQGILPYDLAENGDVAYVFNNPAAGERSVVVVDRESGDETPYIEPADGFSLNPPPDIRLNASGRVAFSDSGSIVVAESDQFETVLDNSVELFGQPLQAAFSGKAFNDSGQIAFIYSLADATFGIGLANTDLLPGDFDADADVDGDDFLIWQSGFGIDDGADRAVGDADADGDVDGADFLLWQAGFGRVAGLTAIPEPGSAPMLSLLVAWLACRSPYRR